MRPLFRGTNSTLQKNANCTQTVELHWQYQRLHRLQSSLFRVWVGRNPNQTKSELD